MTIQKSVKDDSDSSCSHGLDERLVEGGVFGELERGGDDSESANDDSDSLLP